MNGTPVDLDPLVAKFLEIITMHVEDAGDDISADDLAEEIDTAYEEAWSYFNEVGVVPDLTVLAGGNG